MNKPTDTELQKRWEAARGKLKECASSHDPQIRAQAKDWERESDTVMGDWKELLNRREFGLLTDAANLLEIEKTISGLSKLHGIPIRMRRVVFPTQAGQPICWSCRVEIVYDGPPGAFIKERWERFVAKVSGEVVALPHVISKTAVWGTWFTQEEEREIEAMQPERDDDSEDEEADEDIPEPESSERENQLYELRASAAWTVDTMVWAGPSDQ